MSQGPRLVKRIARLCVAQAPASGGGLFLATHFASYVFIAFFSFVFCPIRLVFCLPCQPHMDGMAVKRDPDEKQFVKRAIGGDKEAFGKLYEKHLTKIYRYLYVKLRDRFAAEDLTETVFIKAWQNIGNYKEKGRPFHAYLYQIARTTLVDFYRKNNSGFQEHALEDVREPFHSPDFTSPLIRKEEKARVEQELSKLPDSQREVLTLLFIEEYEISETAQILGKSEGAIRVLKHRGLNQLKKIIRKRQNGETG